MTLWHGDPWPPPVGFALMSWLTGKRIRNVQCNHTKHAFDTFLVIDADGLGAILGIWRECIRACRM
jgi:hypothetical protein